ncbi:hypothetical protein PHAVU_009G193500 [Phaseolus vulgaris]|uniref:Uncharacterized protein n=1 Tax=Phaseolus vulgaris TaxID=3885 RepID=V7B060_PHAVU|nr:hypothetical protein PHAVU_009G193500g [Phaseolus vulgaris]ESW10253.1 hypothetical protein PHAVU_009G193500g [Phaseolus vulgaris]
MDMPHGGGLRQEVDSPQEPLGVYLFCIIEHIFTSFYRKNHLEFLMNTRCFYMLLALRRNLMAEWNFCSNHAYGWSRM